MERTSFLIIWKNYIRSLSVYAVLIYKHRNISKNISFHLYTEYQKYIKSQKENTGRYRCLLIITKASYFFLSKKLCGCPQEGHFPTGLFPLCIYPHCLQTHTSSSSLLKTESLCK